MPVHLSTPLLNDELAWIRRLEKLRHKKLLIMGQFRFRYLRNTLEGNWQEMIASAAGRFVSNVSARQDTTTSSEITASVGAVERARLTISSTLLALAKVVLDDDRLKAE